MPIDWQQILFDPKKNLIGRFDQLAKKRFWDENLADEAFIWILDKLKADDWARLASFNGHAQPATFLHTVFLRLLEDFSRHKFGYPRPKTWLKNLGDFWVQIWKRLCLEREPPEQIKMSLGEGDDVRELEIKQIMVTIKAKEPDCAQQEGLTTIGGADGDIHINEKQNDGIEIGLHHSRRSVDERIHSENLEDLLQVVGLLTGMTCRQTVSTDLNKKLQYFSEQLKLEPGEQLILQMKFQEGMRDAAIARAMDMSNYQVKSSLKVVIQRLNKLFIEADISINELYD